MNKFSAQSLMEQSYSPKSLTEHLQTMIPLEFKSDYTFKCVLIEKLIKIT